MSNTSMKRYVGTISTVSDRPTMVNMINVVSPAPFNADETMITSESNIDHAATNFIAAMAWKRISANSVGSAFAENG